MVRLVLPLAPLQSCASALAQQQAQAESSASSERFGVMLGSAARDEQSGEMTARMAHVWINVDGVSAAELQSSLPSGVAILGSVALTSAGAGAGAAFLSTLPQQMHFHVVTISAGQQEASSNAEGSSAAPPAVTVQSATLHTRSASSSGLLSSSQSESVSIDAEGAVSSVDLVEQPVFTASLLASWHGSTPAEFIQRCEELLFSLRSPDKFAWAFSSSSNESVHPSFRGRILVEGDEQGLDATAWSLLSDENPLVARKKAHAKAAAVGGGGGGGGNRVAASSSSAASAAAAAAAPVAPLPIAEYAVELSLLQRSAPARGNDDSAANSLVTAPTLQYSAAAGGVGSLRTMNVVLSVLHYSSPSASVRTVLAALYQALVQQVVAVRTKLATELPQLLLDGAADDASRSLTLQALHFQPLTLPHALTVLFLHESLPPCSELKDDSILAFPAPPPERDDGKEETHPALLLHRAESVLKPQRLRLHQVWNVRTDTPSFRFVNAVALPSLASIHAQLGVRDPRSLIVQPRLFDVHLALPRPSSSSSSSARQHVVQGHYAYYHYMQDRQSDAGWGCAYRTLQTVCSWAILQGFVSGRNVPSIKAIQSMLVRCGDKPSRFIGSSEWIGSTEVGFVLREAYGLVAKTLFVSSGEEVPSHARALAKHFDQQGTPVMIGGGVLAYGLLGVEIDPSGAGETKYLILDPHYTGQDALPQVIKGGWCAWKKGSDVFRPDAFYNFALLQRPPDSV